jgi:hypothetical protein
LRKHQISKTGQAIQENKESSEPEIRKNCASPCRFGVSQALALADAQAGPVEELEMGEKQSKASERTNR